MIDSTGLKIFGEGEWKVRQHGAGKRRTWPKVHFAVDANLRYVIGVEVTTADVADCEVFERLLEQIEGLIAQVDCDGTYDTHEVYTAGMARRHWPTLPCGGCPSGRNRPKFRGVGGDPNHRVSYAPTPD